LREAVQDDSRRTSRPVCPAPIPSVWPPTASSLYFPPKSDLLPGSSSRSPARYGDFIDQRTRCRKYRNLRTAVSPKSDQFWSKIAQRVLYMSAMLVKQGVALTGHNRTVPPCSVGRRIGYAPGPAAADRPRALHTTTDDADSTTACKKYWPIRRASNNWRVRSLWEDEGSVCLRKEEHTLFLGSLILRVVSMDHGRGEGSLTVQIHKGDWRICSRGNDIWKPAVEAVDISRERLLRPRYECNVLRSVYLFVCLPVSLSLFVCHCLLSVISRKLHVQISR